MTQLPTLSGDMRELRDGDRVRLRCGMELTIENNGTDLTDPECWWSGQCLCDKFEYKDVTWGHDGKSPAGVEGEYDIVLILGPAEEPHGDGTVTRLCTIPVTMPKDQWEEGEPIAWRATCVGDTYIDMDGDSLFIDSDEGGGDYGLILRPKPAPTPSYQEKLIEAVKAGTLVLPPKSTQLVWDSYYSMGSGRDRFCWWFDGPKDGRIQWNESLLGPLPERTESDPISIDLAPVRDATEGRA